MKRETPSYEREKKHTNRHTLTSQGVVDVLAATGLLSVDDFLTMRAVCSDLNSLLHHPRIWPLNLVVQTAVQSDVDAKSLVNAMVQQASQRKRVSITCHGITDAGLAHLSTLSLQTLYLSWCTGITDEIGRAHV